MSKWTLEPALSLLLSRISGLNTSTNLSAAMGHVSKSRGRPLSVVGQTIFALELDLKPLLAIPLLVPFVVVVAEDVGS